MKKIIVTLTIALLTFTGATFAATNKATNTATNKAANTTTNKAANTATNKATNTTTNKATNTAHVPETVNTVFAKTFGHAREVKWETGKNFYKATFEFKGRTVFAFFAGDGDLMGVATNLSPVVLPETLRTQLKTTFPNYWITDLFRYHNADDDGFVVTLEGPENTVTLRALGSDDWTIQATRWKE